MKASWCALALAAACCGCARQAPKKVEERPVVAVAAPVVDAAVAHAAVMHDASVPALSMSVDLVLGSVRAASPVRAGRELAANTTLQLAAGAKLTLTLRDFVRLSIYGPARVRVLPDGEPALLVHDGVFSVDVAARGVHSVQSAFWFATPDARFDVPDNVRAAVHAVPDKSTEVSVVSGYVKLPPWPGDRLEGLTGGMAAYLYLTILLPRDVADTTLERAVARMQRTEPWQHRGASSEQGLAQMEERTNSGWLRASAREQEIVQAHHEAVGRDAGEAFHLRANLAQAGVQMARLREQMRALEAQRRARTLTPP